MKTKATDRKRNERVPSGDIAVPKGEPLVSFSPLEHARLAQFKRIFPRECALLIAEYEAQKAQGVAND